MHKKFKYAALAMAAIILASSSANAGYITVTGVKGYYCYIQTYKTVAGKGPQISRQEICQYR